MNAYINRFKTDLAEYEAQCSPGPTRSILDFLWYCYSESNPVDDGRIHLAEQAITPVFDELSIESSDALTGLVSNLCTAYQRAAFLEGIQIGFHLNQELEEK